MHAQRPRTRGIATAAAAVAVLGLIGAPQPHVLQFQANGHVFQATLGRDKGAIPPLEPGSLVRVTGMMPTETAERVV